jgi:hypothetical protein
MVGRLATVAVTVVVWSVSPMTTSASKRVKRPRTLDTPRWRMLNPIEEWLVSTAQRPGAKGSETVVDAVVMGASSARARCPRRPG